MNAFHLEQTLKAVEMTYKPQIQSILCISETETHQSHLLILERHATYAIENLINTFLQASHQQDIHSNLLEEKFETRIVPLLELLDQFRRFVWKAQDPSTFSQFLQQNINSAQHENLPETSNFTLTNHEEPLQDHLAAPPRLVNVNSSPLDSNPVITETHENFRIDTVTDNISSSSPPTDNLSAPNPTTPTLSKKKSQLPSSWKEKEKKEETEEKSDTDMVQNEILNLTQALKSGALHYRTILQKDNKLIERTSDLQQSQLDKVKKANLEITHLNRFSQMSWLQSLLMIVICICLTCLLSFLIVFGPKR